MNLKTTKSLIQKISKNRYLKTEQSIKEFENCVETLYNADVTNLGDLLMVFTNDTEATEVMFSLLHLVEHIIDKDKKYSSKVVVKNLPEMKGNAFDWAELLIFRFLKDSDFCYHISNALSEADDNEKLEFINMLNHVKDEDETLFDEVINEILKRYLRTQTTLTQRLPD